MPLLQVKGPGSIFETEHSQILSDLEASLPKALEKVCPAVQEAIVVSGRTRRLVKLTQRAANAPITNPPVLTSSASPAGAVARVPPPLPALVNAAHADDGILSVRSDLPRLTSVSGQQAKCALMLTWLNGWKLDGGSDTDDSKRNIFRDERMVALLGKTYDQLDETWRNEFYEKVVTRCFSRGNSREVSSGGGATNAKLIGPLEFDDYGDLLRQAFLGQIGANEPRAIVFHLKRVRMALSWAKAALTDSLTLPSNSASFDELTALLHQHSRQAQILLPSEREGIAAFLRRRREAVAQDYLNTRLREAESGPRGLEAVRAAIAERKAAPSMLQALSDEPRQNWLARQDRLIASSLTPMLESRMRVLTQLPEDWAGLERALVWKREFDRDLGEFRELAIVAGALGTYTQRKQSLLSANLARWREQVNRLPENERAIDSESKRLSLLFPTVVEKRWPIYGSYSTVLKQKQAQFQPRRQLVIGKSAPMVHFNTAGLNREDLVRKVYEGRFEEIRDEDPYTKRHDKLTAQWMFLRYVDRFGQDCPGNLPANKVEMDRDVCVQWGRTIRVYDQQTVSRWCAQYSTVGRGYGADPRFHELYKGVWQEVGNRALSSLIRSIGSPTAMQDGMALIGAESSATADVVGLFRRNSCSSPALKHFGENLLSLVRNEKPAYFRQAGEDPKWSQNCSQMLPTILPGQTPAACDCLFRAFDPVLSSKEMSILAQQFTREHFLLSAVSESGLIEEVAKCLK